MKEDAHMLLSSNSKHPEVVHLQLAGIGHNNTQSTASLRSRSTTQFHAWTARAPWPSCEVVFNEQQLAGRRRSTSTRTGSYEAPKRSGKEAREREREGLT